MPEPTILNLNGHKSQVRAHRLTSSAFRPFGAVIANPRPDLHPSAFLSTRSSASAPIPHSPTAANQGTAIKYQHVSPLTDLYPRAPSGRPAQPVMSMFVCAARPLRQPGGLFPVRILERHPFTTQTFAPLRPAGARYLVVVAPSLAADDGEDGSLPVPLGDGLPGGGMPDVDGLRAFVATAGQAVTYGAGTWHAPMVALEAGEGEGEGMVDFLVVQFANGVAVEDCQECVFEGGELVVSVGELERARL